MFFVFDTARSDEEISKWVSSKAVINVLCSHSAFISCRIQSSSSFSARARYSESVCISSFEFVYVTEFGEKIVVQFQHSKFPILEKKEPDKIGNFCSICALVSSTSYNEFFTWSSFLNSLLSIAAKCLSVTEVLHHSVSAAVHFLITIGAIRSQLLFLCDYTGDWILVTLYSCVNRWLQSR